MQEPQLKYRILRYAIQLADKYIENPKSVNSLHGSGSYPCPPQGWQRLMRFMVSQNPFINPYFLNASMLYWEHVGVNLHFGPSTGEIANW